MNAVLETPKKTMKSSEPINKKVTVSIETITPAIAKKWLNYNEDNRPQNELNKEGIATDMKKGKFMLNNDCICFDWNGKLINGQHRLTGCIESGESFECGVMRNMHPDTFKVIDTGKKRDAADVLSIEGVKNAHNMAGIIKFIMSYKAGKYSNSVRRSHRGKARITNAAVSEFYHKHKDALIDSYDYGYNKYNKLVPGSQLAGLHYIFKSLGGNAYQDAGIFCSRVADGENLEKSSPMWILRHKLESDFTGNTRFTPYFKLAIIVKAWNAFRSKKPIKNLTFSQENEEFPKAI